MSRAYYLSVLAALLTITPACTRADALTSPRLSALGNRHLRFPMPPGWSIVKKDPVEFWYRRSYEFSISPSIGSSKPHSLKDLTRSSINIEILSENTEMARVKKDLQGERFIAAGGLRGIVHSEHRGRDDTDWYLAISDRNTNETVTVRIVALTGSLKQQDKLIHEIYQGISISNK